MNIASSHFVKVLLLGAGFALAGCVAEQAMLDDNIHTPTHASDRYPISVAKGPETLDVSSTGNLNPQQVAAIHSFIRQAVGSGASPLTVSRPNGGGASAATASQIANLMAQDGVPRNRVIFMTHPAPADAPVRLSFISAYAVQKKPCGNWSKDLTDTENNTSYPNLGCAVQTNIAAEIANPDTLLAPMAEGDKDALTDARAVSRAAAFVNGVDLTSNYIYQK